MSLTPVKAGGRYRWVSDRVNGVVPSDGTAKTHPNRIGQRIFVLQLIGMPGLGGKENGDVRPAAACIDAEGWIEPKVIGRRRCDRSIDRITGAIDDMSDCTAALPGYVNSYHV